MAILFDELDDRFWMADHASLTLQDGDWCVAVWTLVTDLTGTDYQYLLSNGNYSANNSFNLYVGEAGAASPNRWWLTVEDGDGTTVEFGDSVSPGADGLWRLIICQRRTADNEIQMWFCLPGGVAVKTASAADAGFNAVNGGWWAIGARQDLAAAKFYGNVCAEFWKADFSLTQEEITALGAGLPPWKLGASGSLDVYLPMGESVATLRDLVGGNDATRVSAPTTAEHAPVAALEYSYVEIFELVAAALPTTRSHREQASLSLSVFQPTVNIGTSPVTYTPDGSHVGDYAAQIDVWQHTISALGGYDKARFTINDRRDRVEGWLEEGLGRHVVAHNPALEVIWEGFVDRLTVDLGRLSVVRGPLLDIVNRNVLIYSTIDTSTTPPVLGERTRTAAANNTASQERYGIIEKILSAGGATAVDAVQIRNTYLAENAWPTTSQRLGERGGEPSVTLDCLGYFHWLDAYAYNQTAASGTVNLSVKLAAVLTAQLNTIIASQDIGANTLAVDQYENDDKTALALVKALTAMGDAAANRWLFGVYAGRRAVYAQAPTDVAYHHRLGDSSQQVETLQGGIVEPWDVLPGRWLFLPNFLAGRTPPTNRRLDPRFIFIESVTFTAPRGLSIMGGKVDELPQVLGRLGLAGVGG